MTYMIVIESFIICDTLLVFNVHSAVYKMQYALYSILYTYIAFKLK